MTEYAQIECLVAAILANAAVDPEAHSPTYIVKKYHDVLQELRKTGGLHERSE